jgi:hypothetical protein
MDTDTDKLLADWQAIPAKIDGVIAGRSDEELRSAPGSDGMSMLELVHHITQANIVAASMVIAACGASGCTYDWSWLWPNKEWVDRMGYNSLPSRPAIDLLAALTGHVSNVISNDTTMLTREVRLFDSPGAETYAKTVSDLIKAEIDHADEHLSDAAGRN